MSVWDGKTERRRMNNEDHDVLIEIRSDVKHFKDWANRHDKIDTERFELANKRISWVEKIAYLGIGGLAMLNIFLNLFK